MYYHRKKEKTLVRLGETEYRISKFLALCTKFQKVRQK